MTETVALSFWLLRHRLRTVEKLGDDKLSTSRNHMLKMNLWILLPLQLRYEFEITSICFIPMHDDWTLLGVVHLVYMLSTCLDSFYTCLVLFWWWLSFWLITAHMLICFIFRTSDQFEPLLFECLIEMLELYWLEHLCTLLTIYLKLLTCILTSYAFWKEILC